MAGTKEGGKRAYQSNTQRYGESFYSRIGSAGGKKSRGGGFASSLKSKDGLVGHERAVSAGILGGQRSKRGHKFQYHAQGFNYYIKTATGELVRFKGE